MAKKGGTKIMSIKGQKRGKNVDREAPTQKIDVKKMYDDINKKRKKKSG